MLSILNDDCLLLICKYLNAHDHISLANTTEHLGAVVGEFYRSACFRTTSICLFVNFFRRKDMFEHFWKHISASLQQLDFQPQTADHYVLLRLSSFTNLKQFSFSLDDLSMKPPPRTYVLRAFLAASCLKLQHLRLKDIDWAEFVDLQHLEFPQLTRLDLSVNTTPQTNADFEPKKFPKLTNITFKHITLKVGCLGFTKVTELVLFCCNNLKPQYLESILKTLPLKKLKLSHNTESFQNNECCRDAEMKRFYAAALGKCRTLEELTLDYHYFCMFGEQLANLENLRKLHFALTASCDCFSYERPMTANTIERFSKALHTFTILCADLDRYWLESEFQAFFCDLKHLPYKKTFYFRLTPKNLKTILEADTTKRLTEFEVYGILERRFSFFFENQAVLETLRTCIERGSCSFMSARLNQSRYSEFFQNARGYSEIMYHRPSLVFYFKQTTKEIVYMQDYHIDSICNEILDCHVDFILEM